MGESLSSTSLLSPRELEQRNDVRGLLRRMCLDSLYFLCKAVIGFRDFSSGFHQEVCNVVQTAPNRFFMVAPRDFFKTSIAMGRAIQLLLDDVNARLLFASAGKDVAVRRLRRIKHVFEQNRAFRYLWPETVPDFSKTIWSGEEIIINRTETFAEPSISAIGVGSKITGNHFNAMIKDDLIDETCLLPDGSLSPSKLADVCQWHDLSLYLFEDGTVDRDLIIGTRWGIDDYFEHVKRMGGYMLYERKAIEQLPSGEPYATFAERYPLDLLAEEQEKDPVRFALMRMNDPRDSAICEAPAKSLKHYTFDAQGFICPEDDTAIPLGACNKYLLFDPAVTRKRASDPTGFVKLALDCKGRVYILQAVEFKADPTGLIDRMYALIREDRSVVVGFEAVSFAKLIKPSLDMKLRLEGANFLLPPIREFKTDSTVNKESRMRGIFPLIKSGKVYVLPGEVLLSTQVYKFPNSVDKLHALDALAYGPQIWQMPPSDEEKREQEFWDMVALSDRNKVTGY